MAMSPREGTRPPPGRPYWPIETTPATAIGLSCEHCVNTLAVGRDVCSVEPTAPQCEIETTLHPTFTLVGRQCSMAVTNDTPSSSIPLFGPGTTHTDTVAGPAGVLNLVPNWDRSTPKHRYNGEQQVHHCPLFISLWLRREMEA
ncbi:unnamed protein product [Pleuronectes platessa]|uniref:Uncharacterized protein n=1 Tax=Pleuronectes platessa TaxID=8262 RepID=A0A9N7V4Z9_PLEPL|nr:unnamed protein product [Pleuronectes platessa]